MKATAIDTPGTHQDPLEALANGALDSHPLDGSDSSENDEEETEIDKIKRGNHSTAAGDLQVVAEWIHGLKAAYAEDVFVKRIREGEQIPNFRVASGVVYYRRPDHGVGVSQRRYNCNTR